MGRRQFRAKVAGKQEASGGKFMGTQADLVRRALDWFSTGCNFTNLTLHGNVGWQAMQLVVLGVLWAWSDRATLTKAFEDAAELASEMFGAVAVTTYPGFTGALRAYTEQFLPQLWSHMHCLMER